MSGKPNEVEIAQLRKSAAEIRRIDSELDRLRKRIAEDTKEVEGLSGQRNQHNRKVLDLLNRMDLASSRNFGWEQRMVWFLAELTTQAEQCGRAHP